MAAIKPVISSFVEKVITPKIQKFAERCGIAYSDLLIPRGEHFEEYLHRSYKKYSVLNTLVFKNEQRFLKDLYLPLTLCRKDYFGETQERVKVDRYPVEIAQKYNKLLITDTAGMGKSTLTKRLFLDIVENGLGIPLYIELRRLSNQKNILQEIQEQVNSLAKEFDSKLLLEFLQTGGFIIILDGYDEISLNEKSTVTSNIQDFISKAGNNTFIMTSRPEQALASFGDFQNFCINPLAKKEAFELLRKYDNQGNTSRRLIDELKSGKSEMINDFLTNPLLVSLLFAAYDYKQTTPIKKHIFYRQVYDAYFDSHDLSKGDSYIHEKLSHLDIDDFDRVLRHVGFKCIKKQKIEFEKDALLGIIDEAKEDCSDLDFNSSDLLNDLLSAVPLFCQDGQYYRWVHKSLQEYFAAQFIFKDSKKSQESILKALYNSPNLDNYINLLDIYYDIDNKGFNANIKYQILSDYVSFFDRNYYENDAIPKDFIEERIGFLYGNEIAFLRLSTRGNIDDIFNEARNLFKESFNQNTREITLHANFGIFVAIVSSSNRKLLPLLFNRQKDLFKFNTQGRYPDNFDFMEDKVCVIDVQIGNESVSLYNAITFLLKDQLLGKSLYLDYNACKNEMQLIEQTIKRDENVSDLTEGL